MEIVPQQSLIARVQGLGRLPAQQKLGLMLAVAAIVALFAGAWMWGQTPEYRVLYSNLSDRDGGSIISALQQMNVPYKFADGSGAILVPANQVHEMRLRLAGQGLPKGGLVGFELMENQKLGTSQFLEQVNYQRALEGELARSVQALSAVQNARVHLAITKPSVFVRDQQKPSASVVLSLYPGKLLDPAQVSAVVHLVASSVAGLPPKNVTVVDQNGSLLSSAGEGGANPGLEPGQLKYVQEVEQSYAKRIEAILTPLAGAGNLRAQVTAEVDFSQVEQAAESYKPNQAATEVAIRSQQSSEASASTASSATGVPGASSNQPPAAGAPAAPAAAIPGGSNAAPSNARKESTVNYELDKTIRYTRQPMGGIKRLSVAVVVNHRREVDAKGKVSYKPWGANEMVQITTLVKEAVGYNQARGDTLNVVNSAFTAEVIEPLPEIPLWKQPETLALAKEVGRNVLIAALVLYLVLGVLRPLLRKLAEPRPLGGELLEGELLDGGGTAKRRLEQAGYEQNLQMAKQLARQDPKLVANVVKNWVADDER